MIETTTPQTKTNERRPSMHEIEDAFDKSHRASRSEHQIEAGKRTARRRRVAGTVAGLALATGIVASNGGPGQAVENAKNFPAHVEWVFGDREQDPDSDQQLSDVSEPDENGMTTFTPKG